MISNINYPGLLYDDNTGRFYSEKARRFIGYFDPSVGYCKVSYNGKKYRVHRLAWLFLYGTLPKLDIDHIDGDKSNNKITNLREVSKSENKQNTRKYTSINKSTRLLGTSVHKLKNSIKYRAQIRINGKNIHLGLFNTPEEAYLSYLEAKRKYHKGNTL